MVTEKPEDHVVVEINVKSVRKPVPSERYGVSSKPNAQTAVGERVIEDVLRLVVKAPNMNEAITKTITHLRVQNGDEGPLPWTQ